MRRRIAAEDRRLPALLILILMLPAGVWRWPSISGGQRRRPRRRLSNRAALPTVL